MSLLCSDQHAFHSVYHYDHATLAGSPLQMARLQGSFINQVLSMTLAAPLT
jgi:hypothetical protein